MVPEDSNPTRESARRQVVPSWYIQGLSSPLMYCQLYILVTKESPPLTSLVWLPDLPRLPFPVGAVLGSASSVPSSMRRVFAAAVAGWSSALTLAILVVSIPAAESGEREYCFSAGCRWVAPKWMVLGQEGSMATLYTAAPAMRMQEHGPSVHRTRLQSYVLNSSRPILQNECPLSQRSDNHRRYFIG